VAGRADEVQAGVDAEIDLVLAAGLLLLEHIRLVLVVKELDNGHPRVPVVDIVAKARRVDHGQANYDRVRAVYHDCFCIGVRTLEELLFQLGLGNLNLDRLVDLLLVPTLVVGVVLNGCGEERVDESRLA
jgi:hypothetical protein